MAHLVIPDLFMCIYECVNEKCLLYRKNIWVFLTHIEDNILRMSVLVRSFAFNPMLIHVYYALFIDRKCDPLFRKVIQ